MSSYCQTTRHNPVFQPHHDQIHGFPCDDDNRLFEYYCLEIAQAGLSWQTIVKKHQGMKQAFDDFSIRKVAHYAEDDINRLMQCADVIKYRLKIEAIIGNAQAILAIQDKQTAKQPFAQWLYQQHCDIISILQENSYTTREALLADAKKYWIKILKTQFRFVGKEIVGEFLTGIAYLPDAHDADCPIGQKISAQYGETLPYYDLLKLLK